MECFPRHIWIYLFFFFNQKLRTQRALLYRKCRCQQFSNVKIKKNKIVTLLSFHLNLSKWENSFFTVGQVKLYKLLLNKQQVWAVIQNSLKLTFLHLISINFISCCVAGGKNTWAAPVTFLHLDFTQPFMQIPCFSFKTTWTEHQSGIKHWNDFYTHHISNFLWLQRITFSRIRTMSTAQYRQRESLISFIALAIFRCAWRFKILCVLVRNVLQTKKQNPSVTAP